MYIYMVSFWSLYFNIPFVPGTYFCDLVRRTTQNESKSKKKGIVNESGDKARTMGEIESDTNSHSVSRGRLTVGTIPDEEETKT